MNGPDPLAQLRDIHVPEPLGWWPPAPGWWLLALLLAGAIVSGCWLLYRQRVNSAYRRLARRELASAWASLQRDGDRRAYGQRLNQVLRRAAREACPAPLVNPLQGEAWLAFLDKTLSGNAADSAGPEPFSRGPGRELLILPYRPAGGDQDLAPLHHLALRWLSKHSQPKVDSREAPHAAV